MDTPATKHYQEMEAAVTELQLLKAPTVEQVQACAARIQKAWVDLRTDYGNLMQHVGMIAFTYPHLGDFSNWVQVENDEGESAVLEEKDS